MSTTDDFFLGEIVTDMSLYTFFLSETKIFFKGGVQTETRGKAIQVLVIRVRVL